MSKHGPILILDDDIEDQELYTEVLSMLQVKNDIQFFQDGPTFLNYLLTTGEQPFIIICDLNLPKINGLELRRKIEQDKFLKKKSIPFIFISTSDSPKDVEEAYELSVQGYFKKPYRIAELQELLKMTLAYWGLCRHPNNK